MKHFIAYFMLVAVLFACTTKDKEIPKHIMGIDTMKIIIWDLTRAGAYAALLDEKDTSKKTVNTAYLAEVLKLHNLSKKDFFTSFDFYQQNPVLNQQLFDSLNSYAQRQRGLLYKRDSL